MIKIMIISYINFSFDDFSSFAWWSSTSWASKSARALASLRFTLNWSRSALVCSYRILRKESKKKQEINDNIKMRSKKAKFYPKMCKIFIFNANLKWWCIRFRSVELRWSFVECVFIWFVWSIKKCLFFFTLSQLTWWSDFIYSNANQILLLFIAWWPSDER